MAERRATEHFERLFEALQERKSEMLRSIEQSRNRRMGQLKAQVEEYQGMLENSGLVGYAQEVLKETDQSCFVQTAKQLHVRLEPSGPGFSFDLHVHVVETEFPCVYSSLLSFITALTTKNHPNAV